MPAKSDRTTTLAPETSDYHPTALTLNDHLRLATLTQDGVSVTLTPAEAADLAEALLRWSPVRARLPWLTALKA